MNAMISIESIINLYNLSFSTRWRALEQYFLVNGNGCYWTRDGNIDTDTSSYDENVFPENSTIKSLNEMMEMMKDYPIPHITDSYLLKIKFEQGLDVFKQKNHKKIAANQFYFFESQIPTFKDLSRATFNHLFLEVPDNVQPDWKALIIETACVVQKGLRDRYYVSGNIINAVSWSDSSAYNTYMVAENRLKTLK